MLLVWWDKSSNGFNGISNGISFWNQACHTIWLARQIYSQLSRTPRNGQAKKKVWLLLVLLPWKLSMKKNKELGSLTGEENSDQVHLKRYIKVLQAKCHLEWNKQIFQISSKQSRSADPCTFGQKTYSAPRSKFLLLLPTPPGHSHVIHSYCYSTVYICVMSVTLMWHCWQSKLVLNLVTPPHHPMLSSLGTHLTLKHHIHHFTLTPRFLELVHAQTQMSSSTDPNVSVYNILASCSFLDITFLCFSFL